MKNHTSNFVVTFDHLTGKFGLDEETALACLGNGNGTIFNNDSGEWIPESENTSESFDVDTNAMNELLKRLEN